VLRAGGHMDYWRESAVADALDALLRPERKAPLIAPVEPAAVVGPNANPATWPRSMPPLWTPVPQSGGGNSPA